ncbi:MAG: polysaccharide deacetylase family protein [Armatimonadota bacterium]|nr:polysaccharide deacetylase family protein [Armatimonadota bacterium]
MNLTISTATWKYDKDWVYSITYDEALSELHRFVIPVHLELGIPGHLEAVAGHIGKVRALGESSYNGLHHMGPAEMREMIAIGWGVGCHSWSHGMVMDDPDLELRRAKEVLGEATGVPVTLFTAPGSNANLMPPVLEKIVEYGYLAGLGITDDLNYSDADDLVWTNRVPIHESYGGYFESAFEPYKRIRQAQERRGWIVDYCHCPLEEAVHECKDVTAAHHRERLETIAREGGAACWYANPDDVIDYRYMRRHTRVEPDGLGVFILRLESLPQEVKSRDLTFLLQTPATVSVTQALVDGSPVPTIPSRAGVQSFTLPVHDGMKITVKQGMPK